MKYKYTLIDKLPNLTRKEMDLLFYATKYQDEQTGIVEGVYYKDVENATNMCKQSFYNALTGLQKKKIVMVEKASDVDYNITILGNAFPNKGDSKATYSEGYINLNRRVFHSPAFKRLKANEKYMLFEFLKGTHESGHSIRIKPENLYNKFMNTLGVSKRVIRGYLHNLRKFFSIGVKDGMYYITYLHSKFEDRVKESQELQYLKHLVKKECNRLHISYTQEALVNVAGLIKQYRSRTAGTLSMINILMNCIKGSVMDACYKERFLQEKYIHKLVIQQIESL